MSRPLIRLHKTLPTVFTACCLGLPLLQTGCGDADAADKQVREQLAEGEQKADTAVTAPPSIPEGYKKAAAINNASPPVKVEALTRLADAERDRAVALLGEADRMDVELYRLIGAINRQSARIQSNNTLIAGLVKFQPTKAQQAIQQQRSAAQGEQNPVWVEHETGAIQGLKGLKEQSAQLQDQIGQLEKQSKDLATQRSKMIADAEQLERQSEEAKGQQSSELYGQSVDSRRQAADLGVQIEALEAKLTPLREDLARAQANEQAITKTVQTFGGQLQATQQNWEKIQAQIVELQSLNKKILGGGGGPEEAAPATRPQAAAQAAAGQPEADAAGGGAARPAGAGSPPMAPSIAGKLAQLNALVAEIESRRTEAEGLLKSALGHTKNAGDTAANLVRDLRSQLSGANNAQRPERKAWEQMTALNNPSRFKLKQATLDIVLAGLYRARAADLATRNNMVQFLTAALKPADMQVPQSAGGQNLATEADATRKTSLDTYAEADQLLKDVIEAPKSDDLMGDAAKAGHLMQLVRIYSQAQADPQNSASLLASAKGVAAQGEAVQYPTEALPAFVLDALELRPSPTTGPASRPGTAPPGTATPSTAAPAAAAPGTAAPGTAAPGTGAPDAATPTPTPGTGTPATPPAGAADQAQPPAGGAAAPAPEAK